MLTRILSALIALPIAVFLIEMGGLWFLGLVLFVGAVSVNEAMGMAHKGDRTATYVLTAVGTLVMALILTGRMSGDRAIVIFAALVMFVWIFFLFRIGDQATVAARASLSVTGILWAGGLLAATASLRLLPGGSAWLYLACVIAWGSDTGGYFAGRFFGKHKLYEAVSPKKTWEGSVGGVVAATAGAFALNHFFGPGIDPVHLAILAPVGTVLGQIGDLAESLLKRSTGVKDSGRIMPGHGGLFDRIDALIFVGPLLLAYAVLIRNDAVGWLSVF